MAAELADVDHTLMHIVCILITFCISLCNFYNKWDIGILYDWNSYIFGSRYKTFGILYDDCQQDRFSKNWQIRQKLTIAGIS